MDDTVRAIFKTIVDGNRERFTDGDVIEFGSLDINGTIRDLLPVCRYTGVDAAPGTNVDIVSLCHTYDKRDKRPQVVLSFDMLEHDPYWEKSLRHMYDLLAPGGLMFGTCAGPLWSRHGTIDSPHKIDGSWTGPDPMYYKGRSTEEIHGALYPLGWQSFATRYVIQGRLVYWFGIKRARES